MKKLMKKLTAIILMAALIACTMPLAGLEGVLKFSTVTVKAAQVDPFDTSKLTKTGAGNYAGASWTTYDNGLLWVVDDKSGETSHNANWYDVDRLLEDTRISLKKGDIKYIYWDITAPDMCSEMFRDCTGVIEIIFGNTFVKTSGNLQNMWDMFSGCYNLTSLDLSGFDTSNVTDMANMFKDCQSLTSLDLSGFNTSNVTDMVGMFKWCYNLTSLNLSGFNTSNVTRMNSMFSSCRKLKTIDVSSFDTTNVTDMSFMFSQCKNLESLNLSGFDTTNVKDMSFMFFECFNLTSVNLSGFDTLNVTDMREMFYNCNTLKSLDLSSFNTSKVTDMKKMFYNCNTLKSLDLSNFNTSKVTDMSGMYEGCNALTSLDIRSFDVSKVTDMRMMFYDCNALTSLDLSSFDLAHIPNLYKMFWRCTNLHLIKLPRNQKIINEYLPGDVWYKLNSDKTVDRSAKLEYIPVTTDESITIIREWNHTYSSVTNGIGNCSVCGLIVKYGDCNDDSIVNVSDAVMLKKYLAGDKSVAINLGAADVNADQEVKVEDAVKLMKHLAGVNVKLGEAE